MRSGSGILGEMNDSRPPLWRWLIVVFLVWVLLATAAWLPRRSHSDPLTVAVGLWPGCETLLLARERGMLTADHVQLIEMSWASATIRAFGSGVVDAAVLSLDEVMHLRETGRDFRVVMVMDASKGGDALIARDGMQKLEDLKGRRVGVDLRGAGMYLLTYALERAGLKSTDLELVPMNLPETEDFFTSKEVDAVVTSEPWLTRLKAAGANSVFDSSQAQTPVYRVLVVSSDALRAQKAEVVRVMRAHFAMMKVLCQGAQGLGMDAVLRRQELSKEAFAGSWSRLKPFDLVENRELIGERKDGLGKAASQVEEKMRANGLLYQPLSANPWIDGSLLKGVRP
ncbi:MAG: ABC-type nitrate/sulfonate/bicarbonate transport system protein [Verrucomicrobiaceae bacterium]|nr:ABC-type nitrate/sulfonate/bicarbonate transport system protein [Verrucomicrobiaceae bacterium]